MTGLPVVELRVTLNSRSCVPGRLLATATAHPVGLVSISLAGVGVNAFELTVLSLNLNDEAAGQVLPAGGLEMAMRSDPMYPPVSLLAKTFTPMIAKSWLSPSFGKSGNGTPYGTL